MALASTLCELHHPNPASSTIILTTSAWDPDSHRFSPPVHQPLPLLGEVELLAAGVVQNFTFGQSQLHVVLRKGSALLIGCFDVDMLTFEVLVEVELPSEEQLNKCIKSQWAIEGCWLLDGPVFVAQKGGKFVIVHTLICKKLLCSDTSVDTDQSDNRYWNGYVLNLEGIGDNKGVRALYCGELKAFAEPDLLLSIQFPFGDDFESIPSHRFRSGWNFVRVHAGYLERDNTKEYCGLNMSWHQIPLENSFKVCNHLFPSDMCPELISCLGVIPKDPVTTVSSLANPAYHVEDHNALFYDIVIGFWNGKIVKYRTGTVVAESELEDAPISLKFAIVAGGQGILLCVLNGELSTVVALCAETLHILRAWSGFQDALVGDFQMIGHDQLLFLSLSSENDAPSKTSVNSYLMPQQLTDLKICYFSSLQEPSQPDSSVGASEVHKIQSLNAMAKCLQSRVEAGLVQMKNSEEQRATKAELVHSSCKLLQEMTIKHESFQALPEFSGHVAKPDFLGKVMQASIRQHGTCGRTWFLLVDIQNVSQEDIVLHDLSLSLTTIRGLISGTSSVVKSLCAMDKAKHIVAAVSLIDLPDASTFPTIHILLGVTVSIGAASCKRLTLPAAGNLEDGKGNCCAHTVWIGQVDMANILNTGCLDPTAVPLEFRKVALQHTFMIQGTSEEQYMEVLNAIKATLKMEYRVDMHRLKHDPVHELVASQGALWSDATIFSAGKTHMVILRAEDSKHLSALKACLMMKLENELQFHITAAYPEILKAALRFSDVFKEELKHKKSLLKESDHAMLCDREQEMDDISISVLHECELQMSTDRHFFTFLAGATNSQLV